MIFIIGGNGLTSDQDLQDILKKKKSPFKNIKIELFVNSFLIDKL